MAHVNKQATGEIRITYHAGPDIILPIKFWAQSFEDAQKVALKQAVAALIIDESPALENASCIRIEGLSIEL